MNGMVQLKTNKIEYGLSQPESSHEVKVKRLGFILGLWLVTVFFLPLASRMYFNGAGLQLSYVVAILWPEILFFFILKSLSPNKLHTNDMIAIVLFFIAIMASSIVSIDKINTALFFILTIFVFIIILQFKTYLVPRQYLMALKTYSLLALLVAILFAMHDYRPGIRLGNGTNILNPNAISLILMSIVVTAMAYENKLIKVVIAGAGIYMLYLTGSRTSFASMIIGVSVYIFYSARISDKSNKFYLIAAVFSLIVLSIIYADSIWLFINDFFKIDHSQRGLASGASGRAEIWLVAWSLFVDNIVTGIGYRVHEQVMGISAHNGYLATLLEIGVIGFVGIMFIIIKGILIIRRNTKIRVVNNYNPLFFGYCLGYMFLALFERYLVNIGNPSSLLFLVAILAPYDMSRLSPTIKDN